MRWSWLVVLVLSCSKAASPPVVTEDEKPAPFIMNGRELHAAAAIRNDVLLIVMSPDAVGCGPNGPLSTGEQSIELGIPRGHGDFFSSYPTPVPVDVTVRDPLRDTYAETIDVDATIHDDTKRVWLELAARPGRLEIAGRQFVPLCPGDTSSNVLPRFDESRSIDAAVIDGAPVSIARAIVWRKPATEGVEALSFYTTAPDDCDAAGRLRPVISLTWSGTRDGPMPAFVTHTEQPMNDPNHAAVALQITGAHYSGVAVVSSTKPSTSMNGTFDAEVCISSRSEAPFVGFHDLIDRDRSRNDDRPGDKHALVYALGYVARGELSLAFSDQPLLCDTGGPVPLREDARVVEMELPIGLGDYYRGTPVTVWMTMVAVPEDITSIRSIPGSLTLLDLTLTTAKVKVALDGTESDRRTQFSAEADVPLCRIGPSAAPLPRPSSTPLSAIATVNTDGALELLVGKDVTCKSRGAATAQLETRAPVAVGPQPANYNEDVAVAGASDNAYLRIETLDRAAGRIRGAFSGVADTTKKTPLSGTFDAPICP